MPIPRRTKAFLVGSLVLIVGIVTSIALLEKDRFLADRWIEALRSSDVEVRVEAAERLVAKQVTDAIPDLLDAIDPQNDFEKFLHTKGFLPFEDDVPWKLLDEWYEGDPANADWAFQLAQGDRAASRLLVEEISRRVTSDRDAVFLESLRLLRTIGPDAESALPAVLSSYRRVPFSRSRDFWEIEKVRKRRGVSRTAVESTIKALVPRDNRTVARLAQALSKEARETSDWLEEVRSLSTDYPTGHPTTLKRFLEHEDVHHRFWSTQLLGLEPWTSLETVEALFARIDDKAAPVRQIATKSLDNRFTILGLTEWADTEEEREEARQAAAAIEKRLLEGLKKALRHDDPVVREAAVVAFESSPTVRAGAAPDAAEKVLELARTDPSPRVRKSALSSLGTFHGAASCAVEFLLGVCRDENPELRSLAADAIGSIGHAAERVVPVLTELLGDSSPNVRVAAAESLHVFGRRAAPAVDTLISILEDSSPKVVEQAVETLGGIGPPAASAVPALSALANRNPALREEIYHAIEVVGGSVPDQIRLLRSDLKRYLADEDLEVFQDVEVLLSSIGELGTDGQPLRSELLEMAHRAEETLASDDSFWYDDYIVEVAEALSQMEPSSEEIAQRVERWWELAKKYDDLEDPEYRDVDEMRRLLEALAHLASGTSRASSVEKICAETLRDPDRRLRLAATRGLAELSDGSEELALALAPLLSDTSHRVRAEAARTLSAFGPAARGAKSALEKALEDPHARVRRHARRALDALRPREVPPEKSDQK